MDSDSEHQAGVPNNLTPVFGSTFSCKQRPIIRSPSRRIFFAHQTPIPPFRRLFHRFRFPGLVHAAIRPLPRYRCGQSIPFEAFRLKYCGRKFSRSSRSCYFITGRRSLKRFKPFGMLEHAALAVRALCILLQPHPIPASFRAPTVRPADGDRGDILDAEERGPAKGAARGRVVVGRYRNGIIVFV